MSSIGGHRPIVPTTLSKPTPSAAPDAAPPQPAAAEAPSPAEAPQTDEAPAPKKPSWPKRPDGTTDWELVFEGEESGLIALVSQARGGAALRECTIAVIEQLYVRDDDPEHVARFKADLRALIRDDMAPENVVRAKDTVAGILRGVKEFRIQKAADYVAKREAEKQARDAESAPERRGADRDAPPEIEEFEYEEAPRARRRPPVAHDDEEDGKARLYWIGGIAAALVLATCVGAYLYFAKPWQPEKKSPTIALIDQMKDAAVNPNPPATHVFGGALRVGELVGRKAITAERVPADACGSAAWVFANRGNVLINGMMPNRVAPNILAKLCEDDPNGATVTWIPK